MQNIWVDFLSDPAAIARKLILLAGILCVVQVAINRVRARKRRPYTKADAIADSLVHSMVPGSGWKTKHEDWAFLCKNVEPDFRQVEMTRDNNGPWNPVVITYKTSAESLASVVKITGAARKRLIKAMAALHKRLLTEKNEDAMNIVLAGVDKISGVKCPRCGLKKSKED